GMVEDVRIVIHEPTGQRSNVLLVKAREGQETEVVQADRVLLERRMHALSVRLVKVALDSALEEFPQLLNDAAYAFTERTDRGAFQQPREEKPSLRARAGSPACEVVEIEPANLV